MNCPVLLRRRPAIGITALLASAILVAVTDCTSRAVGSSPPHHPAPATTRSSAASPSRDAGTTNLNVYGHTLPGDMSPALAKVPERVYVPNSESASVDVIDPRRFKVVSHYPVGQYPQHITPSWDLRWLYVNNTYSNSLTVIDPRTGRRTGKVIPVTDPYNLYFTPDGQKVIVVAEAYQRLDFYNARTWRLLKHVAIPAVAADGRSLVVSAEFSGWVVRVSTTSMRVTGRSHVGGLPVDVKLSPDGKVFYVANQGLSGVTILNATTLHRIGFLATGNGAHGLAVSRNTKDLYVSNRLAGTISVINFATRRVAATWHVGGSPDMEQVSADGKQLWVSNRFNASVSVISTRTGKVLHVIDVGSSPHGLAFFPQPGRYSLGHNGVYR
jgi:YVTN family beta-propeller protein